MIDYSESLIAIKKYRKMGHEYILKKDWTSAANCFYQVEQAAKDAEAWCLNEHKKGIKHE